MKRLKALKMKELRAKLERIGAEGGKKLEESKKIVLTQDPSLPVAVKVRTLDHALLACSH